MKLKKITLGSLGTIIFMAIPVAMVISCEPKNKNALERTYEKLNSVNFSSNPKEYQDYVEKKLLNLFKTEKIKTKITSDQIKLVTDAAKKITEEALIIKNKEIDEARKLKLNDKNSESDNIYEIIAKAIAAANHKYNITIINKISEVANKLGAWENEELARKVDKSKLKSKIDAKTTFDGVKVIFLGKEGYTKDARSNPFVEEDIIKIIEAAQNISEPSGENKKEELLANKLKAAKQAAKKFIDNNEIFDSNYIPPHKFIFKPIFTLQDYKIELKKILEELKFYNPKFKKELQEIQNRFNNAKSIVAALEVAKEEAKIRFLSQN
ncbi:MAG: hypothetical protein GY679_04580 [Mycoplasma sp.]|nr:hypothetical protein [Mycoplasma sp.]